MKHKNSGSTLVLSMIVLVVLAVGVAAAFDYTANIARDVQNTDAMQQAIAAGNGCLDSAFLQWRATCKLNENMPLSSSQFTLAVPSFSSLFGTNPLNSSFLVLPGGATPITLSVSALNATDPTMTPLASTTEPIPSYAQSPNMPTYNYLAEADVTYNTFNKTATVKVCRVFEKVTTSPWLYAIFFNDDLEVNPGASFNVTGWVQTNGNLYTGGSGQGKNYLNFDSTATYAGSWVSTGQWDPDDTSHSGAVAGPTWSNTEPSPGPQQLPQNASVLTGSNISSNPNTSDGYREIIERPVTTSTDPLFSTDSTQPSERYYYQAGVKILINTGSTASKTTVTILNSSGTAVSSSSTGADLALYNTFANAITTNQSLQDARENSTLTITTLDVSQLVSALSTGGSLAGSGANIIYISDETANNGMNATGGTNPSGPANRGIELINGWQLPTGGLTVVSDNPVYILGNYNTSVKSTDTVPSNSTSNNNPAQPTASNYTMQPAAVMADAVTILSNAWTNANSTNGLSSRTASDTTVNTALLSGIVTSGNGFTYSGGAENYLRLLENWSGKTLTYYGSMVELYKSKQAIGVWKSTGNYYNAPTRQWYFNSGFYTSPPPGTFKIISYVKSRWFQK